MLYKESRILCLSGLDVSVFPADKLAAVLPLDAVPHLQVRLGAFPWESGMSERCPTATAETRAAAWELRIGAEVPA